MKSLEKVMEINPFESQKSEKGPEGENKVEFEKDELVEKTLEKYSKLLPSTHTLLGTFLFDLFAYRLRKTKKPCLTPAQIAIFLHEAIRTSTKQKIENAVTGIYLSGLIQESYNKGNNNFFLNTQDGKIDFLGSDIIGEPSRPVKILITGNAGHCIAERSRHCKYYITGTIIVPDALDGGRVGGCVFETPNKRTYEQLRTIQIRRETYLKDPEKFEIIYTGK